MCPIKTPDQRIRVFISSTLQELAEERKVVQKAVNQLRLIPVMFELGARPHPPRDLYRAYLEQSHIFIGIYWNSYGWVAPGMDISGLEDEYRLSMGKPRLIYVKQPGTNRQPALERLLKEVQGADVAYKKFKDLEELGELVENDLALLLSERFDDRLEVSLEAPAQSPKKCNLPYIHSPLIDRQLECTEVISRLPGSGLLTLTGPGGTGKSRLALEIATRMKNSYKDGTYFVSLESIKDAEYLIPAIAHVLGIFDSGRQPVEELLSGYLSDKNILVILDNFEHLLAAATAISKIHQQCPDVHFLITSRTPLKIRGEQIYPLGPLPHPSVDDNMNPQDLQHYPAVELFLQRSRAVNPMMDDRDESLLAVAEICSRLDGLPLAIELAASHTKYLSPIALTRRMDHLLDLLTNAPQDYPSRQQTMRKTISWSSDLLSEDARQIFFMLGCFRGSWTLEAADEICHPDPIGITGILNHIEQLVDAGLVYPSNTKESLEEPRFQMLQTIREFALETLKSGEHYQATAERHANYFCHLAEYAEPYLWTPQASVWVSRLEKDLPDFREAFQWARRNQDTEKQWILTGCLAQVFTAMGMSTEFSQWIIYTDLWSEEGKGLKKQLQARTLYYAGVHEFFSGKFQGAWDKLQRAVKTYQEINDQLSLARALTFLGLSGITLGKVESMEVFHEAMSLGEKISDHYSVILSNIFLAETMMKLGKLDESGAMIMKVEPLVRQSGDQMLLAAFLITKGNYGIVSNNRNSSISSYSECIQLHQFFSQMSLEGWGRLGLAYWSLFTEDQDDARPQIMAVLELAKKSGDLALKIGGMLALAGLLALHREQETAAKLLGGAEKISTDSGYNLWSATLKLYEWSESTTKSLIPEESFHANKMQGKNIPYDHLLHQARELIGS